MDVVFQHPDGAASNERGGHILLRTASSDNEVNDVGDGEVANRPEEQGESSGDEALFLPTSPTSSQQQQQEGQSPGSLQLPGLGVILEDIESHLQHRMTFLRGRESSGSRESSTNSLVVEYTPGAQEGIEEAVDQVSWALDWGVVCKARSLMFFGVSSVAKDLHRHLV